MIKLPGKARPSEEADGPSLAEALWIDLFEPTEQEVARVAAATGLTIPSREALSEVEASSRLRRTDQGLFLSTPMVTFGQPHVTLAPLGFVLAQDRLVTVRFHDVPAIDTVAKAFAKDADAPIEVFLRIVETLVDQLADLVEEVSSTLDELSTRIFEFDAQAISGASRRPERRRDLTLRRFLQSLGREGKTLSRVRATLLGLDRAVPFVGEHHGIASPEQTVRLETVARDIKSLDEFESRLTDTVQFLLDAALGLISIEQNNAFRVLTVVSAVGVPPTLVASIYGMNFEHMPELDWLYGYPYGLALILLSAVVPAVAFRVRGWL